MKFIITLFIIVVNTFVFSQLPSYVPKNGLVGYWPFDGNANDFSGNNNHGVVKGATLIIGRTGVASTAYNLNGNDNIIEVPHNTFFNLDTAFSINLWVKLPTNQVNNPASYVSKYSLAQKSGFVFPYVNEGASGFGLNLTTENGTYENAAGQGQYLTSQISNKTSWHQFTAVFSNGTYKLYVDGFVVKTNSGLGNTLVNNTNNLIFGNSTGYNQFAKGGIDEVGIWNRSLTENEIIVLNGCVAPLASITANTSTNICPGTSVVLSANSGTNLIYQWYRNDTLIPNATNISYNADKNAAYTVVVKSGPCPTKSTPTNVTYSLPNNKAYNPFNDTVYSCINDVVLDAGAGFTSYLWDDQSTNQTLTIKEPGFHKVKITYGNNCTANDSVYVNLIVQAKIRANDTTICYRNQLLLTNEPSIPKVRYIKYIIYSSSGYYGLKEFEIYLNDVNIARGKKVYSNVGWYLESVNDGDLNTGWISSPMHFSFSSPHYIIIDLEKEYYIDYITLKTGCIWGNYNSNNDISILTSSDSLNWKTISTKSIVDGDIFTPTFYNGYSYKWYKNDNLISSETNRMLHVKFPGIYKLEISKNDCNSISKSINVKYDNPPTQDGEYDVFQDSIVSCGKDLVLDASVGYKSYFWNDSLKTQTKTITKSGSYSATVEYGTIGCKAKDSVFVDVVKSVLNQKDTTICFGNSVRLTNKETQPGIRYVKMEVTSSSSESLVQHIDVFSNGTNVALDKTITSNKGNGIQEIVRPWAGNGWCTPGSTSTINDPSSFVVDLGRVYETTNKINTLSFQLNSTLNYNVYVSADNLNWVKIITETQVSGIKTHNLDGLNLFETIRNYQWYKNNSPISTATQYNYTASESGSYTLKVTKGSCIATSNPVKITVESPTVNNTAYNPFQDSIVSCGKDLVLEAGVGYKSYFWNDSLKTQTKTITKSGSYSATVEYGTIGCKAKDSVFVDVVKSVLNQKDTTICFGNSVLLKQGNKRSSLRYIKFESYASADANQVNVYEIEAYSKGTNVALGKNTTVNSGGGGFSVVDGNGYSRWSSNRGDFGGPSIDHPHFIIVDLGSEYDFNQPTDRIVVNIDGFDHWKQTFSVLVSSDNNTWLKIGNEDDKTGIFTYTLGEVSLPGYNYQWYNDNNLISNANQYTYEVKESGTYTLKVKKGNCEVTSTPVKITVDSPSKLPFNPIQDTVVACNQDVVLDAGIGFSSYTWSDGKNMSIDTIKKSGNYSITVSFGKNGCTLSDQGFIQVIKPTLNLSDSILVCNTNDTKFLSAIDTTFSIGYSYQWYKDGNKLLSETNKYITTKALGSYQLELSKDKCILKSKPLIIYVITTPPNPLSDSLIGCGNPVVLDVSKYSNIIWSIPSDKGNYLNYSPKITTDYSGSYSVQFTYRSCPFSDQVVVSNLIPYVQLERQVGSTSLFNILCGDEQIKIVNTISNSNFLNPHGTQYDWYKNSSLLPNHFDNILVSDSGIYTLKLKYKSCTVTSDTIRLSKKALPSNALYFSNSLNLCKGANVTVKALADGTYKWSTGSTNQSILLTSAQKGTYFVNITDKNGCVAKSETFNIVDKTVPSVNICMVTTLNNKNLLIWNNDLSDIATLAKYRIYKQNSTNSTYDMIHEQSITGLSEYVDSTSQPSQQIARYKLSIIDSCGNEKISSNHTTMLLTSNLGVNGTVNLLWNPYEGFVYDNFEIWRSENGVDYVKLDQVSNNTFSYIDNNPPASCFYQLRIENKMVCNSSKRGSYNSVRSNIIDKNGKSLSFSDNIELTELVKLFPNPSSGLFTLTNIPLDAYLTFMDITGKEIMKLNMFDRKIDVDLSKLVDNGVYFLKVQSIYQEDQIIKFNIFK